ncbi:hypothetical protein QUW15_12955 [Desulfovibrio piger]|nr:hypothetical protein [Desulfovibrio piger]
MPLKTSIGVAPAGTHASTKNAASISGPAIARHAIQPVAMLRLPLPESLV